MKTDPKIISLEQLLERLAEAAEDRDRVPVGAMVEAVGQKSFGPLLVLAGVIALSPLSGIPGVPTLVALVVLLTTVQLLLGRQHVWLPRWLVDRGIPRDRYARTLKWMGPIARFVDRFFRARLTVLTRRVGVHLIAIVCVLIALLMPPMELLPFSATTAGAALTAFGLSLIAQDGLVTLIALLLTAAAGALVILSIV